MTPTPQQRAIAEYRAAHPENDDIPDEAIGKLLPVSCRAFGIALQDLNKDVADHLALTALGKWLKRRIGDAGAPSSDG